MNKEEIKYDKNCEANYNCNECDDYKYFPCKCNYLQKENKQLESQLQEKEKIIEDIKDKLYCWGEVLDPEFQQGCLSILERK